MLWWVDYRLIVQRNNSTKDKYYPQVLEATATYTYPFTVPTANITIRTNKSPYSSSYISPIRFDDIVTLQVSTRMSPTEKHVWENVFEGRIRDISSKFGTSNNTDLFCVGHINEAAYTLIGQTTTWPDPHDAVDYLNTLVPPYMSRITQYDNPLYMGAKVNSVPTYSVTKDQNHISDLFSDLEKIAGYDWLIGCQPTYDAQGNLSYVYLTWKPFSTTATEKYKIIEGTSRFVDADFASSGEDVITYYRVNGDTYTSGTSTLQYTAFYTNASAVTTYGKRGEVETATGIKSNAHCQAIADGVGPSKIAPVVSGTVTIIGTPQARLGDLVFVDIPSEEINGAAIYGNYSVYRVTHRLGKDFYTTLLDVGKVRPTVYDYFGVMKTQIKKCGCNFVKVVA